MSVNNRCKFFESEYGVLQVLTGHKQDVRTVRSFPNGAVLTGSRDLTAKLFRPIQDNFSHSELKEAITFRGPENFVSSICYGRTKSGETEIYVGCHDMKIYVFNPDNSQPKRTLTYHSGPVCSLAFRICDDKDILVSGSWDSSAVVWRDNNPEVSLTGHIHAVWSVAFVARSYILTGGADKTIRKWDMNGKLEYIFEGHTDCVRGLAVINGQSFLSCSNDCSVIMWNMNGGIVKTFDGHTNFIYDICIVREPLKPGADPPKNRPYCFVTVSEDKTVKIWSNDVGCIQTIPLQATTLWSVTGLDNGNFVVGTADGHAYVFSNVLSTLTSQAEFGPQPSTSTST